MLAPLAAGQFDRWAAPKLVGDTPLIAIASSNAMTARGFLSVFSQYGPGIGSVFLLFFAGCMALPDRTQNDDPSESEAEPAAIRNMTIDAYALGYRTRDGSYASDVVATSEGYALATYKEYSAGVTNALISSDGGRSWSDPIPLTGPAGSDIAGMALATVAAGPTSFAIVLKTPPASMAEYDNSPWELIWIEGATQDIEGRFTLHPAPGSPDLLHAAIDLAAMPDGSLLLATENTKISEPTTNHLRLLSGVSAWRLSPDGELDLIAKLHEPMPMDAFTTSVAVATNRSGEAAVVWSTVTNENRGRAKHLFYATMDLNGSFSRPESFEVLPPSHPGRVEGPFQVRFDAEGRLHFGVHVRYWASEGQTSAGTDFYHVSFDVGSGEVVATKLNTLGGPDQRNGSGHAGAVDVQGPIVWAAWMEPADGGWTAYAARSTDAGATFEATFRLQAVEYGMTRDHIFLGNAGRHLAILPNEQPLLVATTELPSALPLSLTHPWIGSQRTTEVMAGGPLK